MKIFISHSNEDVDIAEAVINLVRKALNIESSAIRCTSVEGYKLPLGAYTEEQLRQEIHTSEIFIALITQRSVRSTFVLFELGARWATKAPLFPLICDSAGTSLLEGPLKSINALKATEASDILQFIEESGKHLNVKAESASSYLKEVDHLKKLSNIGVVNQKISFSSKNFNEIDANIKSQAEIKWPNDYEMQLDHIGRNKKAFEELQKGRPPDILEEEFFKIRERAKEAWPLDYEMQLDQEKRQVDSLRKLKKL